MATFSYDQNFTAIDSAGNVLAGRVFTVWTAETAGTQLTSTLRDWAGSTVTSGQIVSAADGRVRFKDTTSSNYKTLWLKAPDLTMYPIDALASDYAVTGGVSLSGTNTWTGAQNLSGGASVPDNTWTISGTNGLQTALDAAANPVQKADTANQAAMLALTANKGDWTYRTDTTSVWMLLRGTDPTTLANWVNLGAGATGSVTLATMPAGFVYRYTGGSSDARPTARTDIPVEWWTTDGAYPVNALSTVDTWLNAYVVAP